MSTTMLELPEIYILLKYIVYTCTKTQRTLLEKKRMGPLQCSLHSQISQQVRLQQRH